MRKTAIERKRADEVRAVVRRIVKKWGVVVRFDYGALLAVGLVK